ncbi:MAG: hypothetical protein NT099_09650 [Candidatus Saganbacteria bacterium]|nr:hypothetical protein [Candidatus Saganbacteria bacterium]
MKNKIGRSLWAWGVFLFFALQCVACAEAADANKKYDFEFKNASLRAVLQTFARQSGLNLVLPNDLAGSVTISLKDVTAEQLLDTVLGSNGYSWGKKGQNLFVESGKTMKTYRIQYIEAKQLKETLSSLLGEGDTVSVHEASNSIVVRTAATNLERVARVISDLDTPPIQVLIEAKIIELNAGDNANLGLDVKGIDSNNPNNFVMTKGLSGRSTDTSPQGLYAQVITGNAEAYLSALETRDDFDLVSSPQITTVNHREASLLIGAKYGYRTSTTTQTVTVQQVNYLEVGTKLILTPHISDDGYILMDLKPSLSDGSVQNDLPQETTTETENRVLVKDGQTIILAGLIRERDETKDTGVPYLMSIPILGGFFRQTQTSKAKREVLVFVTPHIITPEFLASMKNQTNNFTKREADKEPSLIH